MITSFLTSLTTIDPTVAAFISSDDYLLLALLFFGVAIILSVLIGLLDIAVVLLVGMAIVLSILFVYSLLTGTIVFMPSLIEAGGLVSLG